jgi:predicted nucleotidyltransferase
VRWCCMISIRAAAAQGAFWFEGVTLSSVQGLRSDPSGYDPRVDLGRHVSKLGVEAPRLAWLGQHLDFKYVEAMVVFGSAARGEQTDASDLDVLIVVDDQGARTNLLRSFRAETAPPVSPLVLTRDALVSMAESKPSFVSHILEEGIVIYERSDWDDLRASLAIAVANDAALTSELLDRALDLETLSRTERFTDSPITALSHLYTISRSVVIARLLREGVHEYSWKRAFDRYAELHPDLKSDIESLKALRSYYEYARARTDTPPGTRSIDASVLGTLVSAAKHLAAA